MATSFLDLIERSASVISEQHDASSINWARGLSDPGEMLQCGYLPEARRLQGENDEDYQARLLVVLAPHPDLIERIKQAALRRAGYDMSNGRVNAAFAFTPPWTALGVVLDGTFTSEEGIKHAGLNWKAVKTPLHYLDQHDEYVQSQEAWAIVRSDTGVQLGTVGSKYAPVQNAEGFAFLDGVLSEYGARYESAGSLYGGKKVWMLAHMPEQRFSVQQGDEIEPYVLFSNSHDGTSAAFCLPTTVRVECANTMRTALRGKKGKGLSIRHTGNVKTKIADARKALGLAVESFGKFRTVAEEMVSAHCSEPQVYFGSVLEEVIQLTAAEEAFHSGGDQLEALLNISETERTALEKTVEKKLEKRGSMLSDIMERYESERCHPKGSVWAAFNAVTEHADHAKRRQVGTQDARASRRFESVLMGEADEMKQTAYTQAVRMMA